MSLSATDATTLERRRAYYARMAEHDQTDFQGLGELSAEASSTQEEIDALEERWMELSEIVE